MKLKHFTVIYLLSVIFNGLIAQERHVVKKLQQINSNHQSDFGTAFYGANSVVFASSRKWKGQKAKIWNGNGQPYLDLYIGDIMDDKDVHNIRKFGGKDINTPYHESNVAFTKDSSTVYFTRNNYFDKKIQKDTMGYNLIQLYKATVNDQGVWENVIPMPFNSKDYQTGHPALNAKDDKLYFTSDMPGTYGETDIFVVAINVDGTYGEPKNLGPNVNTFGKEMFPFIDQSNNLFFSSDGYSDGEGNLDIYVTRIEGNQAVGLAMNVGTPINSNKDDFSIAVKPGTDSGYFSSNRIKEKADDDIYYFEFYPGFMDKVNNMELGGFGVCANAFEGVVKEEGTGALLPGALVSVYNQKGGLIESVRSNDFGRFALRLPCNEESYKVIASKKYYQDDTETFKNVSTRQKQGVDLKQLNLKPTDFVGGGIGGSYGNYLVVDNLNSIYFDLDKYDVRIDAAIELEKVVRVMKRYPDLQIEVASYTDSRADDGYNMQLSEKRAKSTRDWLIDRGIDANRLTAKGYGETHLVNKCKNGVSCSESEHQLNRRTEFVLKNPSILRENTTD